MNSRELRRLPGGALLPTLSEWADLIESFQIDRLCGAARVQITNRCRDGDPTDWFAGLLKRELVEPLAAYMDLHFTDEPGLVSDGPNHAWRLQTAAELLIELLTDSVTYQEEEAMRYVRELDSAWRAFALEERERLLLLATNAARTAQSHADDLSETIDKERHAANLAAEKKRATNRDNRAKAPRKLTPEQVADYFKAHPDVKTTALVNGLQDQYGVDRSTVYKNLAAARKKN